MSSSSCDETENDVEIVKDISLRLKKKFVVLKKSKCLFVYLSLNFIELVFYYSNSDKNFFSSWTKEISKEMTNDEIEKYMNFCQTLEQLNDYPTMTSIYKYVLRIKKPTLSLLSNRLMYYD